MSDMTVYNILKQSKKDTLDKINKKTKELESVDLGKADKKEILNLKDKWNELILETMKLKTDYEILVKEVKEIRDVSISLNKGDTWRYKFVKWLIK